MRKSLAPALLRSGVAAPEPARRQWLHAAGALGLGLLGLSGGPAQAQSAWPNRPIRLVLPSGAGGGADIFGRPLAEFMAKELGQPVVVDNKPGANGVIAAEAMVRQSADGYNLLISYAAAILGNKAMGVKIGHDPIADLKPIGLIGGDGGNMIVVNPALPVNNLKELFAYAKAQSAPVAYGSWGVASGGHLVMEAMLQQAGLKMNHVPYKTVAAIPPDLMAGVLQVSTIDSATPVQLIKAGKLRAIAALSNKRLPQLPDVPTQGEQGFPLDAAPWYGLFGQATLPAELVTRLNALLNRWLVLPETKELFAQKQNTAAPVTRSPEEFAAQIQRELPVWRKMVGAAGVGAG